MFLGCRAAVKSIAKFSSGFEVYKFVGRARPTITSKIKLLRVVELVLTTGALLIYNKLNKKAELANKLSEKHLQTGDALPPFSGKLRLFAMRFCPYTERTVLVMNAKNLQYDTVFVNLNHKPDWVFKYSPKGTVPALEYEKGKALFDSNIINFYLDEKYADVPLQSTDPLRRAEDKMIVELFTAAQSAFYIAAYHAQALHPTMVENYHKSLAALQARLKERGTKFLHGDYPGLVDYTLFPFLERFEALPLIGKTEFELSKTKYELLVTYIEAMKVIPAVKLYYLSPETHAKFIESRQG